MFIKTKKKEIFFALFLVTGAFIYGLIVGHKNIFPFEQLVTMKRFLSGEGNRVPYTEYIDENEALAFFIKGSEISSVQEIEVDNSIDLPYELIIDPDIYTFDNKAFDLTKEGLYRFIFPGTINEQRIVYQNDIDSLMSSISGVVSHGKVDDNKRVNELTEKSLNEKLSLTCGVLSFWTKALLDKFDIKSRVVVGLTLDKWNDYDNGHTLIEVWRDKYDKWVVYDLDNNAYFYDTIKNIPLSFVQFSDKIKKNEKYQIEYISNDTKIDITGSKNEDGFSDLFIQEHKFNNIRDWYKRVIQVPIIYDHKLKTFVFSNLKEKARIESYSSDLVHLSEKEFQKYYDNN